jgi:hypothetical protein
MAKAGHRNREQDNKNERGHEAFNERECSTVARSSHANIVLATGCRHNHA